MDFKGSDVYKNFKHKFKDKILKYIEAMYNQKSDLNKIENLEERQIAACTKAGLPFQDESIKEIVSLKNDDFNELVFHYHIQQNSNKYYFLLSQQQLFWQIQKILHTPIAETSAEELENVIKMRTTASTKCDDLIIRIERLKSEVFATNDVIEMADLSIRKLLTPESRLRMQQHA